MMMAGIPPPGCEMVRVAPVEVAVCLSLSTGRGATDLRLTRNPGSIRRHHGVVSDNDVVEDNLTR